MVGIKRLQFLPRILLAAVWFLEPDCIPMVSCNDKIINDSYTLTFVQNVINNHVFFYC